MIEAVFFLAGLLTVIVAGTVWLVRQAAAGLAALWRRFTARAES